MVGGGRVLEDVVVDAITVVVVVTVADVVGKTVVVGSLDAAVQEEAASANVTSRAVVRRLSIAAGWYL